MIKRRLVLFLLICLTSISLTLNTLAQSDSSEALPPMVAVTDGVLTLYGFNETPQPLMDVGYLRLVSTAWSPDGTHFAFSIYDEAFQTVQLYLTDTTATPPILLANNLSEFPINFTADNLEVIYIREGNEQGSETVDGFPTLRMDVYTQRLSPNIEPRLIAAFLFGYGCNDISGYPMDIMYDFEAGYTGNPLQFTWTSYGMLYSRTCQGIGINVLNPANSQTFIVDEELARLTLLPDESAVYGVRVPLDFSGTTSLVRVDLSDGALIPVGAGLSPDQLAVGANGAVYFSTRDWLPEQAPLSAEQQTALINRIGLNALPQFALELHHFNPRTLEDTLLYSDTAWGIGRMAEVGEWLYFTVIPAGINWLDTLIAGTIDFSEFAALNEELGTIQPDLYRVPINGGEVELVQENIAVMTLHPANN